MPRIALGIEYDGSAYSGWQEQAHARGVQGELERALAQVAGHPLSLTAAGRTDAGVHALGQVITFSTAWRHSVEELQRALNAVLPKDIAVRELRPVAEGFHPRFDAVSRE